MTLRRRGYLVEGGKDKRVEKIFEMALKKVGKTDREDRKKYMDRSRSMWEREIIKFLKMADEKKHNLTDKEVDNQIAAVVELTATNKYFRAKRGSL